MSKAIENLENALQAGMAIRPKVGGFLACQSLFLTDRGPVVIQGAPLTTGITDIPNFNRKALIAAVRADQAGDSTFPQFLESAWRAGVVRYDVDFAARPVAYFGCNGEEYVEAYPTPQPLDNAVQ